MILYYEIFNENSPDPNLELYEMILSSGGKTPQIDFKNVKDKTYHTMVLQLFKMLPLSVIETDDKSGKRTILSQYYGRLTLSRVESLVTSGLLVGFKVVKITDLEERVQRGRLDKAIFKASVHGEVKVKYKEEDFFYKAPISSGELSGDALFAALAKMLLITPTELKTKDVGDLKKLYRLRALALHPDRNNGRGEQMSELNYLWRLYNA